MTTAHHVTAGTRQSGDVLVALRAHPRLVLRVHSPVADLVGDRLRTLGLEALEAAGIAAASVEIHDNAASEWIVRARLRTAVRRWHAATGTAEAAVPAKEEKP
ncbi:citrate lyase acyl carrier protein [Streptomyces huiliensis]|uniref:citrate lyase acyl carrier protein n=1 Tax=Streptomyces huiliensis TaxID=2876027 RepID=UPI001CBC2A9C|nr:citrate lyase acyl carrier protein [Streptomyces huiliensis]MBZ4321614.1 citrate lyase acyl carrier protein [Streptomyces huiliensis]